MRELRIPRTVRGDAKRHHLHDRVLRENRHGGSLRTLKSRPRRAGGVGQRLRYPRAPRQHRQADGRQVAARHRAARSLKRTESAAPESDQGNRDRETARGS